MPGQPLSADTIANIRELRYVDGLTRPQIRELTGIDLRTCAKYAPGRYVGKVPNDLVRQVFVDSGRAASAVAADIGWHSSGVRSNGHPRRGGDASRLLRTLGLRIEVSRRGARTFRRMIDAEVAQNIAEACGVAGWAVIPDEAEAAA